MSPDRIVLASASPRRRDILSMLGLPFTVRPSDVDESVYDHLPVAERVQALAELKARAAFTGRLGAAGAQADGERWVLGADTLVVLDGLSYGKPLDREDARAMLGRLAGRVHEVASGLCLWDRASDATRLSVSWSSVRIAAMVSGELESYLDTGEWMGAAGGYRVQGVGSCFVERIEGSYSSVMGLPIRDLYVILRDSGYPFWDGPRTAPPVGANLP